MGVFRYPIEIAAHLEGPYQRFEALVDTGSLYTWVPSAILRDLGLSQSGQRAFQMANGQIIYRDIVEAVIQVEGQRVHTICVFADAGDMVLLGVVTLEQLSMAADPVNRRLVPMPTIPAVSVGAADLALRRCVPCEGGTPPLAEEAARAYLAQLGDGGPDADRGTYRPWELVEGSKIIKGYRLKSFREAIAFVVLVADLAEAEGHHPDILISWRRVRLELTTHAIGGLSENDFIMAAKIDQLADQGPP